METIWNITLSMTGLFGLGSLVFLSLYKDWLKLAIFPKLTRDQAFQLFRLFMILTFLFCLCIVVVGAIRSSAVDPKSVSAVTKVGLVESLRRRKEVVMKRIDRVITNSNVSMKEREKAKALRPEIDAAYDDLISAWLAEDESQKYDSKDRFDQLKHTTASAYLYVSDYDDTLFPVSGLASWSGSGTGALVDADQKGFNQFWGPAPKAPIPSQTTASTANEFKVEAANYSIELAALAVQGKDTIAHLDVTNLSESDRTLFVQTALQGGIGLNSLRVLGDSTLVLEDGSKRPSWGCQLGEDPDSAETCDETGQNYFKIYGKTKGKLMIYFRNISSSATKVGLVDIVLGDKLKNVVNKISVRFRNVPVQR